MDYDLTWIELHYGADPEEAAALRRLVAAFPDCRSEVELLLVDRAEATAARSRKTSRTMRPTGVDPI
jgi:hypothetical protein